ncbi:hypothetical protein [Phenylobacterium sp.]|uniref:hypothetical protein n=1 Tax=Phenylobacterium sp. TaxID=1871053 RepID=UPI002EDA8D61
MPSLATSHSPANLAIVARTTLGVDKPCYLQWLTIGSPNWVPDPASATTFPSMREATRAATRLPSSLRAFGLPLEPELAVASAH